MTREAERVYTTTEAAEIKRVSPDTIKRAIKSTDPDKHLVAKRLTSGYRIKASDLDDWWDRLEDAS